MEFAGLVGKARCGAGGGPYGTSGRVYRQTHIGCCGSGRDESGFDVLRSNETDDVVYIGQSEAAAGGV